MKYQVTMGVIFIVYTLEMVIGAFLGSNDQLVVWSGIGILICGLIAMLIIQHLDRNR